MFLDRPAYLQPMFSCMSKYSNYQTDIINIEHALNYTTFGVPLTYKVRE